jgi:hypothetical protein
MKFKNPFKSEPTLAELQEKEERISVQESIAEKEAMIAKLHAQGKRWEEFSTNGKKSGIDWSKIKAFIRGNKGGKSR